LVQNGKQTTVLVLLWSLCWICLAPPAYAVSDAEPVAKTNQPSYLICTEALQYYPHYDFTQPNQPSYAASLFKLFSEKTGIKLRVRALPIKRLDLAKECDIRYPDNPLWYQGRDAERPQHFSHALTQILGTTIVKSELAEIKPEELHAISVPRGFTPHHLMQLQQQYSFEFIETNDAFAALLMVLKGRVDAADVEWNVAQALLKKMDANADIAIAKHLPISLVGFHLSSSNSPEFIAQFDQFLLQEQASVTQLKQQFQLREQLSDLTTIQHPTDATKY
jgi:hypothetical protein